MMKLLLLCLTVMLASAPVLANGGEVLTLDQALERVEYHPTFQEWLETRESMADSQQAVFNRQAVQVTVAGGTDDVLLDYTLDGDNRTSQVRANPTLSVFKNNLTGTVVGGNLSTTGTWNSSSGLSWNPMWWEVYARQVVWPSPRLGSDRIALQNIQRNLGIHD